MKLPVLFFFYFLCTYADRTEHKEEHDINDVVSNNSNIVKQLFRNRNNENSIPKFNTEKDSKENDIINTTSNKIFVKENLFENGELKSETNIQHTTANELTSNSSGKFENSFIFCSFKFLLALICNIICVTSIILSIPTILKLSRQSDKMEIRENYINV